MKQENVISETIGLNGEELTHITGGAGGFELVPGARLDSQINKVAKPLHIMPSIPENAVSTAKSGKAAVIGTTTLLGAGAITGLGIGLARTKG